MNTNSADNNIIRDDALNNEDTLNTASTDTETKYLTRNSTHKPHNSCPRCQKPTQWQDNPFKPFCSKQCKLIDLGAWADEAYRVPVQDADY